MKNSITCGFADGLITPVLNGTVLDGYGFRESPAERIRDELHAKVMALGGGEGTFLVFSLDLLALNPDWTRVLLRAMGSDAEPAYLEAARLAYETRLKEFEDTRRKLD